MFEQDDDDDMGGGELPPEAKAELGKRVRGLTDRYAGSLKRSGTENKNRSGMRGEIEEMGYSAAAFQAAVSIAKRMTKIEADHYLSSLTYFVGELLGRQLELFPDEAERIRKREEADRLAKEQAERESGEWSSANARSDPNRGGAAAAMKEKLAEKAAEAEPAEAPKRGRGRPPGAKNKPKAEAAGFDPSAVPGLKGTAAAKLNASDEQVEGEKLLADVGKKRKSQSEIAAEKRAAARLN